MNNTLTFARIESTKLTEERCLKLAKQHAAAMKRKGHTVSLQQAVDVMIGAYTMRASKH